MTDLHAQKDPGSGALAEFAVRFIGLGHAYGPGAWLFRGYTNDVARGSIFALLGPNGCGKTTILKILLGVLAPAEGKVEVSGQIAFVPQLFQVSFDYTALEMVLMGRARKVGLLSQPSRQDRAAALAALDRFALADLAMHPFHKLSGGQRQLVVFARALVAEASILMLDEPASALDLKNQRLILQWMRRLAHQDGLTIVFTTHHPHHALAVADHALLMHGGESYVSGAAETVLTEAGLERLYGVAIKRVSFEHAGREVKTLAPSLMP